MSAPIVWPGLAAGALNSFGVIAAFAPYRYEGKAAIVTPLAAALQPIVTIILALIFLREKSACLRMPTSATGRFDSW